MLPTMLHGGDFRITFEQPDCNNWRCAGQLCGLIPRKRPQYSMLLDEVVMYNVNYQIKNFEDKSK